jgi:hypothetical protein
MRTSVGTSATVCCYSALRDSSHPHQQPCLLAVFGNHVESGLCDTYWSRFSRQMLPSWLLYVTLGYFGQTTTLQRMSKSPRSMEHLWCSPIGGIDPSLLHALVGHPIYCHPALALPYHHTFGIGSLGSSEVPAYSSENERVQWS